MNLEEMRFELALFTMVNVAIVGLALTFITALYSNIWGALSSLTAPINPEETADGE